MTADRLPRAGEHEGLFYAMGYSGHGTQMSVHMGQIMAQVMDGHPDANPLQALGLAGNSRPLWPALVPALRRRLLSDAGLAALTRTAAPRGAAAVAFGYIERVNDPEACHDTTRSRV